MCVPLVSNKRFDGETIAQQTAVHRVFGQPFKWIHTPGQAAFARAIMFLRIPARVAADSGYRDRRSGMSR